MISPDYYDWFKRDGTDPKYSKYKDRVKEYIKQRYEISTKSPCSVYSIRVGFQMIIADIPQSALAYWLEEWGYAVEPLNGTNENHGVYLRLKSLDKPKDEHHYHKEWKAKRRGTVVY